MDQDPDRQLDERLSLYGEGPTLPDIHPDAPGAPAVRVLLLWRLATDAERLRLAWPGRSDGS